MVTIWLELYKFQFIEQNRPTPTDLNLSGLIFVFCVAIIPFWTVEDAGPYKERLNFLMRTSL